jgi:hypothetical protein
MGWLMNKMWWSAGWGRGPMWCFFNRATADWQSAAMRFVFRSSQWVIITAMVSARSSIGNVDIASPVSSTVRHLRGVEGLGIKILTPQPPHWKRLLGAGIGYKDYYHFNAYRWHV